MSGLPSKIADVIARLHWKTGLQHGWLMKRRGSLFKLLGNGLKKGWSGERTATEVVREIAPDPGGEWDVIAHENGLAVRA